MRDENKNFFGDYALKLVRLVEWAGNHKFTTGAFTILSLLVMFGFITNSAETADVPAEQVAPMLIEDDSPYNCAGLTSAPLKAQFLGGGEIEYAEEIEQQREIERNIDRLDAFMRWAVEKCDSEIELGQAQRFVLGLYMNLEESAVPASEAYQFRVSAEKDFCVAAGTANDQTYLCVDTELRTFSFTGPFAQFRREEAEYVDLIRAYGRLLDFRGRPALQ